MEDDNGRQQIAKITAELAEALTASSVVIKLQTGRQIAGVVEGFSIRRKEGKKGDVNWSGNIRVQTDPGVLQIDCLTIDSLTPE
ncbi:MAG TPA: hypothetical protein VHX61_17930 [Rhizomicrobium sp.]|jgi:hypothetical protein|nr:hypothetical protein [Rhizomicrobium sp.]